MIRSARHSKPSVQAGFTLLELSVVILIIALITSGIVAGKALIRSAELREVVGEYDRHVKAVQEFKEKYNQLPGDMTNAVSFWGADSCPTSASSSPKVETCDGDGDGKIGTSTSAGVVTAGAGATSEEWFRMWQHLSDAGMTIGKFSGTQGDGGSEETTTGINIPSSKLANGGWLLMIYLNTAGSSDAWADNYGHIFQFGASTSGSGNRNTYPIITPSEALDLDMKLDDAKPGTGNVRVWRINTNANCTQFDTAQTTATYNTSYTGLACAPFFITGF